MSASASLIPELEHVIQHGSQDKRAATVKRIANLFIDGAAHFSEDHIGLFDDVLCRLIVEIETKARAEMAHTMAPLANAPAELIRQLAHDDDIEVAGPVLTKSTRLQETELVELARTKGQAHLAVLAGPLRPPLPSAIAGAFFFAITKMIRERSRTCRCVARISLIIGMLSRETHWA